MAFNLFLIPNLVFLVQIVISSKDYTDCQWFGNTTNAPIHPTDVCTAHSHEGELDDLWLYSTKMECAKDGAYDQIVQYEWNNTECSGSYYNRITYFKDDGYYFHCDAPNTCPFTKVILRELRPQSETDNHHEHLCAFDNNAYHEVAFVTNICIDFIEEYNISFYVDCNAKSVSYTEYNDTDCSVKSGEAHHFVLKEGCEDEFGIGAYIQVAECDDANYHPSDTSSSIDEHETIIFCLILVVVSLGLIIAIIGIVIRRKNAKEVNDVNVDSQPFNVDFQSIGDEDLGDVAGIQTQHITTEGQDVKEIAIVSANK